MENYRSHRIGYIKGKDGVYYPHHEEHQIIRSIIEMHHSGLTPYSIWRVLKDKDVRTRMNRHICRGSIVNIIRRANLEPHSFR